MVLSDNSPPKRVFQTESNCQEVLLCPLAREARRESRPMVCVVVSIVEEHGAKWGPLGREGLVPLSKQRGAGETVHLAA